MRWLNQPGAPLSAGATRHRDAYAPTAYYWGMGKSQDVTDFVPVSNLNRLVIIADCIFETTYNSGSGERTILYAPQARSIELTYSSFSIPIYSNIFSHVKPNLYGNICPFSYSSYC